MTNAELGRARTRIAAGLVWFLAMRGVAARKVATLLLLGAMAAAIGFQIPNEANFRGYRAALTEDGVNSGFGAVRVRPVRGPFLTEVESLRAKVGALPRVRAAVPLLALPGAVRKDQAPDNGMIFGVDSDRGAVPYRLLSGAHLKTGDGTGILLGAEYADDVGASLGDEVTVYVLFDTGAQALDDDRVLRHRMRVRGIVSGVFGAHEAAFVDRGFLESESGLRDQASVIMVYADPDEANLLATAVRRELPRARVTTWYEDSDFLRSALGSIDALSKVSIAMGISAVAIPVFALLYIDLLRRRREMAVLSAIGLGRWEIFAAFLLRVLLTSLAASVLGALFGILAIAWFQRHPIFEWNAFVIRPLPTVACFARPILTVLATAMVAAAIPAWLSTRTPAARVLRSLE